MGAFRGLFVNYLWLRATRLKEEGKYHEAVQLSEAITKLQPRFPRVWAFHAWNLSYNISVATSTAEERWDWVSEGIDLLRQEAIPLNPNSVLLHKELAWIFVHKVQGFMDDANRYYKRRMAQEWTEVLGEPPRLSEDTDEATAEMAAWFGRIVEAPDTLERLLEIEREAALAERLPTNDEDDAATAQPAIVTDMQRLIARIRDEAGLDLDTELLKFVAWHEALESAWYVDMENVNIQLPDDQRNEALSALLDDPQLAEEWDRLLAHIRRRALIDEYNMEPRRMLRYINTYGPLDWRHPASHAVYWAAKGVEETLERDSTTKGSYINTDRIIVHALQELWRYGTIYYDMLQDDYLALYNLHYTDTYGEILETIIRPRAGDVDDPSRPFRLYSQGYMHFLDEVIRLHYRLGNYTIAQRYKDQLASSRWINTNDPRIFDKLAELSLEEYVFAGLAEGGNQYDTPYVARTEITAALEDGILRGLLRGDSEKFQSTLQYARRVHKMYTDALLITTADERANRMEELPDDFAEVASTVFLRILTSGRMNPLQASRAYEQVPVRLQQGTYDQLANMMAQAGMTRETFDRLFTEPPNMDVVRAQRAASSSKQGEAKQDINIDAR